MRESESGWTKVRRNRRPERITSRDEITYFVTNIPLEANKKEFQRVFMKYVEVKDAWDLEKKLDGTILRGKKLAVNLSKHHRKPLPRVGDKEECKRRQNTKKRPPLTGGMNYRDHRTYADAINHGNLPRRPPPPPPPPMSPAPIVIQQEQETHYWLRKTALIGTAKSLDHLGHLPKIIGVNKDLSFEVKYLGGLHALIEFGCSIAAKKFLTDPNRWMGAITRLEWADKAYIDTGRVAWIRIVGLPIRLWGERNFENITRTFGKTIAPFDDVTTRISVKFIRVSLR
ncbi:hypothetical protein LXL04_008462 [Taraxacum kok-saghyz]